MEVGIAVAREGQRREARLVDDDPQFLLQLPDQGLLGPFARLDLAAGKFPQARHRLACRTLRDQHAPVRIDQGASGNEDDLHAYDLATTIESQG